jgi:hypothetical protein
VAGFKYCLTLRVNAPLRYYLPAMPRRLYLKMGNAVQVKLCGARHSQPWRREALISLAPVGTAARTFAHILNLRAAVSGCNLIKFRQVHTQIDKAQQRAMCVATIRKWKSQSDIATAAAVVKIMSIRHCNAAAAAVVNVSVCFLRAQCTHTYSIWRTHAAVGGTNCRPAGRKTRECIIYMYIASARKQNHAH